MHLSLIIPAYNEEKRLPDTLIAVNEYLSCQDYDYEIIVVNDGSTDRTAESAQAAASRINNFRLLENAKNLGKGGAIKKGMLAAKGDFRLFIDADNAISINHIENFWPYFKKNFDIIIGSIEINGSKTGQPAAYYRHFLGKLAKFVIRVTALPHIRDSQRAFKLFPADIAVEVFSRQTINGWGFDIEVLAIARLLGYKIKELPVTWLNSTDSKVKISDYYLTWRELRKIKNNIREKKY